MPEDFWSNSSGNAMVRRFIDKADIRTKNEIERLIAGEDIEKDISQELTYDEIDKSIENLWSVLLPQDTLTHKGYAQKVADIVWQSQTKKSEIFLSGRSGNGLAT